MSESAGLVLTTSQDTLSLDLVRGSLRSYRSSFAPEQEFVTSADGDPVCVVQYLDGERRYRQLSSSLAARTEVRGNPEELVIELERLPRSACPRGVGGELERRPWKTPTMDGEGMNARVSGLFAMPCGNAMGSVVEGQHHDEIDKKHLGGVTTILDPSRLEGNDDNQMAMLLTETYIERDGFAATARDFGETWRRKLNRDHFFYCMKNAHDLIHAGQDPRVVGHWNIVTGSKVMCMEPVGTYISLCLEVADKYTDVLAARKELYEKCLYYHMIDPLELLGLSCAMFKIAKGYVRLAVIGGTNIGRDSDTISGRGAVLSGPSRAPSASPRSGSRCFGPSPWRRYGRTPSESPISSRGASSPC